MKKTIIRIAAYIYLLLSFGLISHWFLCLLYTVRLDRTLAVVSVGEILVGGVYLGLNHLLLRNIIDRHILKIIDVLFAITLVCFILASSNRTY